MSTGPRFALIGAAGYVAGRHMRAIKEVGGSLVAAFDPNDSVGLIDSYFPDAHFFVEFERFDRHIDMLRRSGEAVHYISICSPNYLHDAHVRFALRSSADAICEKPLVLNPRNIDGLAEIQDTTSHKINTILQLRLHPSILALKKRVDQEKETSQRFAVDLSYITSRGRWYHMSWKGDERKSGGVATNIGVHFFDMLGHIFGPLKEQSVHLHDSVRSAGYLNFERADVRWFLSVDRNDLPANIPPSQTTYRSIVVDGDEIEFSDGFNDLHIESYREILAGRGFGLDVVRPSIALVSAIRSCAVTPSRGDCHPLLAEIPRGAKE